MKSSVEKCRCGWLHNTFCLYREYSPGLGQRGGNTTNGTMLRRRGHRSSILVLLLLLLLLMLLMLLLLLLWLLCRRRRITMAGGHHGRDEIVARVIERRLTRQRRRCSHRRAHRPHRRDFDVIPLLPAIGWGGDLHGSGWGRRRDWRRGVQILQPIRELRFGVAPSGQRRLGWR